MPNRAALLLRRAKITPGKRLPDQPAAEIKDDLLAVGNYARSTTSNAIFARPPLSEDNVKIKLRKNPALFHPDGTVTLSLPLTISSSLGVWIGRLQKGNWVETKRLDFVNTDLQPKMDTDSQGEEFDDDGESTD